MLQRVRELMVQASNDTNTQNQRALIDQEIGQLGREILSMQNRVEFNTNRVLAMGPTIEDDIVTAAAQMSNGAHNMSILAGVFAQRERDILAAIDIFNELDPGAVHPTSGAALDAFERANVQNADRVEDFGELLTANVLTGVDTVADDTDLATAGDTVGETLTSLNASLTAVRVAIAELATTSGGNQMRDAQREQATNIRQFVNDTTSGDNIAFFQVGANASQGVNFDFESVSRAVSGAGWTVNILASVMSAPGAGSGIGSGVRISPMISAVDASIEDISRVRANLGALQNRMDFTMRSLDISSENLQDSESRVRNADVAREMMRFTMTNVLQQAAVSMLAQANQLPNNLLQLLR
jgi:flagellin